VGSLLVACIALASLVPVGAAKAVPVPDVTARSVYAFDPATGEVILEHNPDERLLIGSVTKVATALVVVDHLDMSEEIVIASTDMVAPGFSAMGLQPGDTLTVEQLLTGLLVASGGDAAQAFVDAMNAKAGELELADTQFANPDGEDAEDSWSTARDVAYLYAALEENSALAEMSAMTDYTFTSVGPEQTPYTSVSTNQLAGQYEVISAKTGSTEVAGGCVVLARAISGGSGTEIVAILGSNLVYDETWTPTVDDRWNDAMAVMEAIDANWTPGQNLVAEAAEVATEPVADEDDPLAADTQPKPQQLDRVDTADESLSRSGAEPLLVMTVAGGVLALASVVAWSRVLPQRYRSGRSRN
jgi:D-alanyl-D-alanine carboxypeptidase